MRTTTAIAAALVAATANAQFFFPPRMFEDVRDWPNTLAFSFSTADWNTAGGPSQSGGLIAGEFSLHHNTSIGFWGARDEEDNGLGQEMHWFDIHFTYFFSQRPNHVLGATVGALSVDIEGFDSASWGYLGLVGATRLDPDVRGGGRWTLGYSFVGLNGNESGSGAFVTSDGLAFGLSLAYQLSQTWSLGTSWWTMDLDNGTQIDRTSLGASFRF